MSNGNGHPLEPLSKEEIETAVGLIREDARATATSRFVSVMLREPAKEAMLQSV